MYRLDALLLVPLVLLAAVPASGQMLSDKTGFLYKFEIEAGGRAYQIETVSNFDVRDHSFDAERERLTLHISSGLAENLAELLIPRDLLTGDITVHLNGTEVHPRISANDRITFITLNFTGSGDSRIDISGSGGSMNATDAGTPNAENGGGCIIATAAYGSELAPRVQALREIRDGMLENSPQGAAFLELFNHAYYAVSPHVADHQRANPAFNGMVRAAITPLLATLEIMSWADSEQGILGHGILVILLNAGIYVAAPAAASVHLKRMLTR